jgi:hypothetical protein
MKKIWFFIIALLAIIAIYVTTNEVKANKKLVLSIYNLSENEYSRIQAGDIILRLGYGTVSESISKILNEEYKISHCGIIVPCDSCRNNYKVIHSVSSSLSPIDGVQDDCLDIFIKNSQPNSILITRYKNLDSNDKNKLISWANYYLKQGIPFDHSFDVNDSSSFYCTELLLHIFSNANIYLPNKYLENKNMDRLKFKYFWDSNYFEIIINHQTQIL